jgi:hypothetical protein
MKNFLDHERESFAVSSRDIIIEFLKHSPVDFGRDGVEVGSPF